MFKSKGIRDEMFIRVVLQTLNFLHTGVQVVSRQKPDGGDKVLTMPISTCRVAESQHESSRIMFFHRHLKSSRAREVHSKGGLNDVECGWSSFSVNRRRVRKTVKGAHAPNLHSTATLQTPKPHLHFT